MTCAIPWSTTVCRSGWGWSCESPLVSSCWACCSHTGASSCLLGTLLQPAEAALAGAIMLECVHSACAAPPLLLRAPLCHMGLLHLSCGACCTHVSVSSRLSGTLLQPAMAAQAGLGRQEVVPSAAWGAFPLQIHTSSLAQLRHRAMEFIHTARSTRTRMRAPPAPPPPA